MKEVRCDALKTPEISAVLVMFNLNTIGKDRMFSRMDRSNAR